MCTHPCRRARRRRPPCPACPAVPMGPPQAVQHRKHRTTEQPKGQTVVKRCRERCKAARVREARRIRRWTVRNTRRKRAKPATRALRPARTKVTLAHESRARVRRELRGRMEGGGGIDGAAAPADRGIHRPGHPCPLHAAVPAAAARPSLLPFPCSAGGACSVPTKTSGRRPDERADIGPLGSPKVKRSCGRRIAATEPSRGRRAAK